MAQRRLNDAIRRKEFAERVLEKANEQRMLANKDRLQAEHEIRSATYQVFLERYGLEIGMPLKESVEWLGFTALMEMVPHKLELLNVFPEIGAAQVGGKMERGVMVPINILQTMIWEPVKR